MLISKIKDVSANLTFLAMKISLPLKLLKTLNINNLVFKNQLILFFFIIQELAFFKTQTELNHFFLFMVSIFKTNKKLLRTFLKNSAKQKKFFSFFVNLYFKKKNKQKKIKKSFLPINYLNFFLIFNAQNLFTSTSIFSGFVLPFSKNFFSTKVKNFSYSITQLNQHILDTKMFSSHLEFFTAWFKEEFDNRRSFFKKKYKQRFKRARKIRYVLKQMTAYYQFRFKSIYGSRYVKRRPSRKPHPLIPAGVFNLFKLRQLRGIYNRRFFSKKFKKIKKYKSDFFKKRFKEIKLDLIQLQNQKHKVLFLQQMFLKNQFKKINFLKKKFPILSKKKKKEFQLKMKTYNQLFFLNSLQNLSFHKKEIALLTKRKWLTRFTSYKYKKTQIKKYYKKINFYFKKNRLNKISYRKKSKFKFIRKIFSRNFFSKHFSLKKLNYFLLKKHQNFNYYFLFDKNVQKKILKTIYFFKNSFTRKNMFFFFLKQKLAKKKIQQKLLTHNLFFLKKNQLFKSFKRNFLKKKKQKIFFLKPARKKKGFKNFFFPKKALKKFCLNTSPFIKKTFSKKQTLNKNKKNFFYFLRQKKILRVPFIKKKVLPKILRRQLTQLKQQYVVPFTHVKKLKLFAAKINFYNNYILLQKYKKKSLRFRSDFKRKKIIKKKFSYVNFRVIFFDKLNRRYNFKIRWQKIFNRRFLTRKVRKTLPHSPIKIPKDCLQRFSKKRRLFFRRRKARRRRLGYLLLKKKIFIRKLFNKLKKLAKKKLAKKKKIKKKIYTKKELKIRRRKRMIRFIKKHFKKSILAYQVRWSGIRPAKTVLRNRNIQKFYLLKYNTKLRWKTKKKNKKNKKKKFQLFIYKQKQDRFPKHFIPARHFTILSPLRRLKNLLKRFVRKKNHKKTKIIKQHLNFFKRLKKKQLKKIKHISYLKQIKWKVWKFSKFLSVKKNRKKFSIISKVKRYNKLCKIHDRFLFKKSRPYLLAGLKRRKFKKKKTLKKKKRYVRLFLRKEGFYTQKKYIQYWLKQTGRNFKKLKKIFSKLSKKNLQAIFTFTARITKILKKYYDNKLKKTYKMVFPLLLKTSFLKTKKNNFINMFFLPKLVQKNVSKVSLEKTNDFYKLNLLKFFLNKNKVFSYKKIRAHHKKNKKIPPRPHVPKGLKRKEKRKIWYEHKKRIAISKQNEKGGTKKLRKLIKLLRPKILTRENANKKFRSTITYKKYRKPTKILYPIKKILLRTKYLGHRKDLKNVKKKKTILSLPAYIKVLKDTKYTKNFKFLKIQSKKNFLHKNVKKLLTFLKETKPVIRKSQLPSNYSTLSGLEFTKNKFFQTNFNNRFVYFFKIIQKQKFQKIHFQPTFHHFELTSKITKFSTMRFKKRIRKNLRTMLALSDKQNYGTFKKRGEKIHYKTFTITNFDGIVHRIQKYLYWNIRRRRKSSKQTTEIKMLSRIIKPTKNVEIRNYNAFYSFKLKKFFKMKKPTRLKNILKLKFKLQNIFKYFYQYKTNKKFFRQLKWLKNKKKFHNNILSDIYVILQKKKKINFLKNNYNNKNLNLLFEKNSKKYIFNNFFKKTLQNQQKKLNINFLLNTFNSTNKNLIEQNIKMQAVRKNFSQLVNKVRLLKQQLALKNKKFKKYKAHETFEQFTYRKKNKKFKTLQQKIFLNYFVKNNPLQTQQTFIELFKFNLKKKTLLETFLMLESQINIVLYRMKFIPHFYLIPKTFFYNLVYLNNKIVRNPYFVVNTYDLIQVPYILTKKFYFYSFKTIPQKSKLTYFTKFLQKTYTPNVHKSWLPTYFTANIAIASGFLHSKPTFETHSSLLKKFTILKNPFMQQFIPKKTFERFEREIEKKVYVRKTEHKAYIKYLKSKGIENQFCLLKLNFFNFLDYYTR